MTWKPPCQLTVSFSEGVSDDLQGKMLLAIERTLRSSGIPCEVFKAPMRDQNKLRRLVTIGDAL